MPAFAAGEKDIRADWWEEGETATIRKWSISHRDKLFQQIMSITGIAGEEITQAQIEAAQVPILVAGLKDWTFVDESDKPVPCTRQAIERLSPDYADYIASEIWDFNRGRTAKEQDSFQD